MSLRWATPTAGLTPASAGDGLAQPGSRPAWEVFTEHSGHRPSACGVLAGSQGQEPRNTAGRCPTGPPGAVSTRWRAHRPHRRSCRCGTVRRGCPWCCSPGPTLRGRRAVSCADGCPSGVGGLLVLVSALSRLGLGRPPGVAALCPEGAQWVPGERARSGAGPAVRGPPVHSPYNPSLTPSGVGPCTAITSQVTVVSTHPSTHSEPTLEVSEDCRPQMIRAEPAPGKGPVGKVGVAAVDICPGQLSPTQLPRPLGMGARCQGGTCVSQGWPRGWMGGLGCLSIRPAGQRPFSPGPGPGLEATWHPEPVGGARGSPRIGPALPLVLAAGCFPRR